MSVNGKAEGKQQKKLGEDKERQRTVKNNTPKWKRSGQKNTHKAVGRRNTVKIQEDKTLGQGNQTLDCQEKRRDCKSPEAERIFTPGMRGNED